MKSTSALALLTGTAAAALAALFAAGPASASPTAAHDHRGGAVFVLNDRVAGNQVIAYDRHPDGTLTQLAAYETGGVGGRLDGAAVDVTASQGALHLDQGGGELLAVNPGSDTLSVFSVHGPDLHRTQVVGTGGDFPVSITSDHGRVFVLNARGGGSIQGYVERGGRLQAVAAWHRDLGLPVTTGLAEFTHTPGQVGFTPDGQHLLVTTKAASNSVLTYNVGPAGRLSTTPIVDTEAGTVPFAFTFDAARQLQLTQTGVNAVATYRVGRDGVLTSVGAATPTGQQATCWITGTGDLLAASNAGSGTVSTLTARTDSSATKLADTAAGPGTVDAAFSRSGQYLYVQSGGNGAVNAFGVNPDRSLSALGSVTVPDGVGGEGIVAV